MKIDYLKEHGNHLIDSLIETSTTLSLQDKQYLPYFINVILSDELFEDLPELDREEFELAIGNSWLNILRNS